ncbi:integrin beta-PS isoform X2 [Diabrotica virgifera virgifera]|uniref:Integrin beta n=1 Tax=Diabrotica virgifera virgifera TaxID=50390 RepID=A0ABM5K267_DIAVI|nr:integrin beta-PS isoform X2 [Diabrotica virgifera virgifera]
MKVPTMKSYVRNSFLLLLIITSVIAQFASKFIISNRCAPKETCSECIQIPDCSWCFDPNFGNGPRCFDAEIQFPQHKKCPEEFVFFPENIQNVVTNLELTKARKWDTDGDETITEGVVGSYKTGGTRDQMVQVAPQRIRLKLRPGAVHTIAMKYTQAEDYPLDIYYLMGLSKSTSVNEKLLSLGETLATMKKLTSNLQVGFGTFSDKALMPHDNNLTENFLHSAPYGYKHVLRLSTDAELFSRTVKQANVSGNLMAPKGGFDAVLQALQCSDQIGWRQQARKLLVVATDANFHVAGDGKLGGIIKPNDGYCHLSHDGSYTQSSYQDYPSIEQINWSVKRNSINVIFAVTDNTVNTYEQIAKMIEGSSVGKMDGNSSNIISLIKEQYAKISSIVEMKDNSSNALNIKYLSKCLDSTGLLVYTNKCNNIKVGDVVTFTIDIKVLKCPKNPADYFQTIQIYPVGLYDRLIIDLEIICECHCEKPGNPYYQEHAPVCSRMGTYKCGICECNPGNFGKHCECIADDIYTNITANYCSPPNAPNELECSGRGQCVCNKCVCEARENENERIYGKYCECENFSCERHDGKLCSGPDHGICDCGVCHCKEEWSGPNCACAKSNATCYAPGVTDGKICSGHGTCECGVCHCDVTDEGRYSGKFCERCPTCPDRCAEFKDCVQCQQYKTGPLKIPEDCSAQCTKFTPISADVITVDEKNNEVICSYYDEDDCRFNYVYYFDDEQVRVRAQANRDCPQTQKFGIGNRNSLILY